MSDLSFNSGRSNPKSPYVRRQAALEKTAEKEDKKAALLKAKSQARASPSKPLDMLSKSEGHASKQKKTPLKEIDALHKGLSLSELLHPQSFGEYFKNLSVLPESEKYLQTQQPTEEKVQPFCENPFSEQASTGTSVNNEFPRVGRHAQSDDFLALKAEKKR